MNVITKNLIASLHKTAMNDETYFDSLKTTNKENELSIGELVDEVIENSYNDCGFNLTEKFFNKYDNTNNDKIDYEQFIANTKAYFKKSKKNIIEKFVKIYIDMYDEKDKNVIKSMKNYLNRNFEVITERVVNYQVPDLYALKNLINDNTDKDYEKIKDKVKKAYDDVKKILEKEMPDLQLAKLKDSDITILEDDSYGESNSYIEDGETHCTIAIGRSLLSRGESVLMNTIYHELCHCIVGQGEEADKAWEDGKFKNKEDDYQDMAHSDKIWKDVSKLISDKTGYDIQQNAAEYENKTKKLNHNHEASIVCYNCGWFDIYETFDDDCEKAENNNFSCPECHSSDTKIIYPNENELAIIDDAIAHANLKKSGKLEM